MCYMHLGYLIISLFTHIAVHTGHLPNCSPRAARLQFDQLVSFSQHSSGHDTWDCGLTLNSQKTPEGKSSLVLSARGYFKPLR